MLELKNLIIHTHPEVKEDENASLLLLENLDVKRSDEVLLIGIGTGLIPVYTAKRARKVVATDVNQHAIKCAVKNTVVNKAYNVELREGLLFEPVEAEKFDLILFNAHYILDLEYTDDSFIGKFAEEVGDYLTKKGRLYVLGSDGDKETIISKFDVAGFDAEISATKKCSSEEMVVIIGKLKN